MGIPEQIVLPEQRRRPRSRPVPAHRAAVVQPERGEREVDLGDLDADPSSDVKEIVIAPSMATSSGMMAFDCGSTAAFPFASSSPPTIHPTAWSSTPHHLHQADEVPERVEADLVVARHHGGERDGQARERPGRRQRDRARPHRVHRRLERDLRRPAGSAGRESRSPERAMPVRYGALTVIDTVPSGRQRERRLRNDPSRTSRRPETTTSVVRRRIDASRRPPSAPMIASIVLPLSRTTSDERDG